MSLNNEDSQSTPVTLEALQNSDLWWGAIPPGAHRDPSTIPSVLTPWRNENLAGEVTTCLVSSSMKCPSMENGHGLAQADHLSLDTSWLAASWPELKAQMPRMPPASPTFGHRSYRLSEHLLHLQRWEASPCEDDKITFKNWVIVFGALIPNV